MNEFEMLIKDFNYLYMMSEQAVAQYIVIGFSFILFYFTKNKIISLFGNSSNKKWQIAKDSIHRVITPLIILIFISISSLIISYFYQTQFLDFIKIILIALILSRLGVYALRYIFIGNPFLRAFVNIISLLVWIYALIYLFGFSGFISANLEIVQFD